MKIFNVNFAISLLANWLNLNSAYYEIFSNLSMIAYIFEIQKQNSTNLSQVAKLNSVYIFIL